MCRKKVDKKKLAPYNTPMTIQPIILAAGNSTRMKSPQSKVLLDIGGRSIIQRVVDVIHRSGLMHPIIVINKNGRDIQEALGRDYRYVIQQPQLGTGHAVAVTQSAIKNRADHILVLYGDEPFISSETLQKLIQTHEAKNATLTLVTYYCPSFESDNQALYDFGRILRDPEGNIIGIRELKDCTEEEKKITEVDEILNALHNDLCAALRQSSTDVKDGMDIVLCAFNAHNKTVEFAGAKNPLYFSK